MVYTVQFHNGLGDQMSDWIGSHVISELYNEELWYQWKCLEHLRLMVIVCIHPIYLI